MKLSDRVGASLRRAPYVWLALTLVGLISVMLPATRQVVDEPGSDSWIAWVALGFIVYDIAAGLLFSLRRMSTRNQGPIPENRFAVALWSFGIAPLLFGFAGTAGSGEGWPTAIGLLASVGLLSKFARQLAHEANA